MRNLFLFLWKHHFILLFLLLEALSFYLIARNKYFHQASFLNSSNQVVGRINEAVSNISEYINLKKNNEALARQNAAMQSLLPGSYYIDSALKILRTDTVFKQQYYYINARVVNNSVNRRTNYLTLNKGFRQGVQPEMGVVSGGSLVGIVKDVSDNFSSVLSLLHKDMRISAQLKSSRYMGSVIWEGYDYTRAVLKDIPLHVKLHAGDTVITTSYSAIFPEGILIGVIDEFAVKSGDNFYTITLNLETDFTNLSHVQVVNNVMRGEQKQLELKQSDDR